MKFLILILTFNFLIACLPEETAVRETKTSTDNSTAGDDLLSDELQDLSIPITWYDNNVIINPITLDIDNSKNISLIGDDIHSYLLGSTNFNNLYCLEIRFPATASLTPKRLRVKVIPTFSSSLISGTSTRYFIINTNSDFGNDFCNKDTEETIDGEILRINKNDSNYDQVITGTDIGFVYNVSDVCPTCQTILTSSSVKLYANNDNGTTSNQVDDYLVPVSPSTIDYESLTLRIDPNSNSSNNVNNCSDSECVAQGFSCCQEGQCIKEKNIKVAGVTADPTKFAEAEALKLTDENWYKDYPQFYYACLEKTDEDEIPEDPNEPTDPEGESDARLEALIEDYNCVEELKANSLSDPFHKNPYDPGKTYTVCNMVDSTNNLFYQTVMKRIYANCGCAETSDLNQMVATCPSYTYEPIYKTDTQGVQTTEITAINCLTPPVVTTPPSFEDVEVDVSSKSAPHRFFDTTNKEIFSNTALPSGATGIQEGDEFKYLDNAYIFPSNGQFNMNSIIGQMTVQLDKALPAYKINVDFDKQYLIAAKSGFFQACPECAKDSWFQNFSANPYANYGVGVQSTGWTTRRDTFVTNTTLGNYEDTIFNRACFVPPTMLGHGHVPITNTQDQRLARLKTQAALFINGYQRDWYGFNKGALIGSFDGVSWFAVGKGRIVKSTSNVLYLAINAPFADLTSPTTHSVSIQQYDNTSTAARYDYDPSLEINDAAQNEAGSCQEWHSCNTDSHCISKLGWEYMCADVSYNKTKWPKFEANGATEIANVAREETITSILQQAQLPPGSGTKRCVYRGAGSPCRVDYENITNSDLRKNLTCAPNFYCAALGSSRAFNSEVSRFGAPLDELIESKNHLYGQDANILGRPKHYLNTGNLTSLPSEAITALSQSLELMDPSGAGNFGLCRPGKALPRYNGLTDTNDWNPTDQHKAADPNYRTDYISQIGGCNSTLYTDLRYASCPFLDEEGNHIYTQDDYLNDNFLIPGVAIPQAKKLVTEYYSLAQNSCGLESLNSSATVLTTSTADSLKPYSAFKTIEGAPLASSSPVISRSFAGDACLRKAGAVCHTDLDCSPNRLQASVLDLVSESYFGNSAERTYYEEYLVCSQAEAEPSINDTNFNTYDITKNRCCRPVGESLTMLTEDSPNAPESIGIDTSVFGSLNPTASNRYSRYSVIDSTINSLTKKSNITRPSADTTDADNNKILDNAVNITNGGQWKTIHNAASRTCCGGTWVRKFEDGSNNWAKDRLDIDPANFKCLNLRSPLYLSENAPAYGFTQTQLEQDKASLCFDPAQNASGCIQHNIGGLDSLTVIKKPTLNTQTGGSATMYLSSSFVDMETKWASNLFTFGFLIPYTGLDLNDANFRSRGYVLQWSDDDDPNNVPRKNLITRLPTYINHENMSDLSTTDPLSARVNVLNIRLTDPNPANPGGEITCSPSPSITDGGIDSEGADWAAGACSKVGAGRECCYVYDDTTRILRVGFTNIDKAELTNYDNIDSEIRLDFTPVGTLEWEGLKANATVVTDATMLDHRRNSSPGNALYYLKKLSKLEYNGIPQMVYEPVFCNDSYQKVVPGIFDDSIKTVMDFLNNPKTFYDTSDTSPWSNDSAAAPYNANALNQSMVATQELLESSAVFSDNQFKCCMELGSQIDINQDSSVCCSGTATDDPTNPTKKICKLPTGTNLTVYFNKFVSGEGLSEELDSPLTEDDFDFRTGEPILNDAVLTKLRSLGETFCQEGAIRRGSAFGDYRSQPVGPQGSIEGTLFSIVDDPADLDPDATPEKSYGKFLDGYKWNHHIYCGDGS